MNNEQKEISELKSRFLRGERLKAFGYFALAIALLAYLFSRWNPPLPHPMRKVPAEKVEQMRRLYEEENWSLRELAAKIGLTPEGVRYLLTKRGTELRPAKMRPRSPSGKPIDSARVARLYSDEALSITAIAERLNETHARVSLELDPLGVPRRPHGFYLIKHPELEKLKVGQWIEVPPASANSKPYATFYDMAKREGIKISVQRIADGLYRPKRVS